MKDRMTGAGSGCSYLPSLPETQSLSTPTGFPARRDLLLGMAATIALARFAPPLPADDDFVLVDGWVLRRDDLVQIDR